MRKHIESRCQRIDGAFINGLLSTPLVLPASVAGALAALFVVIIVIAVRRAARGGGARLLIPLTAIAVAAIAVIGILERMATNERMAEQRALLLRDTQLSYERRGARFGAGMPRRRRRRADRDRLRKSRVRRRAKHGQCGRLCRRAPVVAVGRIRCGPARRPRPPSRLRKRHAARSNSIVTASPRMFWRSATAAPPNAAPLLPCFRIPERSRPT